MRLRTRYALVLLVVMLVLATVILGSAELVKRQTIDQEQTELNETARLAAEQVNAAVQEQVEFVSWYAATPEVRNFSSAGVTLDRLVDNSEYFAMQVIDKDGTVVDFQGDIDESVRNETIGTDVSDREYFQRASEFKPTVGDPESLVNETYVVTISAPISGADGTFEGVLVGATELSVADFFSATAPLETSSQTVRVLGETNASGIAALRSSEKNFSNALSSQATVSTTGWTVQIDRDRAALTSRIQNLQYVQLGGLVVVLGTIVGLGVWQYRTNLRQTEDLLAGFDELTAGNFGHRLRLSAAEEWSQISDGFNDLAAGLREREQAIQERERRLSVLNRVLRHNLQNDMTVIQGYAEQLPQFDSREEREEAAEQIQAKARGLVDHGQKARQLEKVMESAQDGQKPLDAVEMVEDAIANFESKYPEVTVETDFPDEAWVSAISAVDFGIDSIVENAFEHNDSDDPTVTIRVRTVDDEVRIEVMDNGSGIPQYERDVLTRDEESSLEHGSGIGLWLSYWAAEKSEGQLRFEDPEDGGGHVIFALPATERPEGIEDEPDLALEF